MAWDLLQHRLVLSPTFPFEQLSCVAIQRFPDPEYVLLCPQIMPWLTELQNDRSARGLWLLVLVSGNIPDPGEHDLSGDLEEKRHMMHGHTISLQRSL